MAAGMNLIAFRCNEIRGRKNNPRDTSDESEYYFKSVFVECLKLSVAVTQAVL